MGSINKASLPAFDRFDRIGKTVREILDNRDHLIDQLAAAYYKASPIDPNYCALVMENHTHGVVFYFALLDTYRMKI